MIARVLISYERGSLKIISDHPGSPPQTYVCGGVAGDVSYKFRRHYIFLAKMKGNIMFNHKTFGSLSFTPEWLRHSKMVTIKF